MKVESKTIIFGRYPMSPKIDGENKWYLQLKPLSSISDEVVDLLGYANIKEFEFTLRIEPLFQKEIDVLRQLGYATAQTVIEDGKIVTYTVEDLVKEGLFKLNYEYNV